MFLALSCLFYLILGCHGQNTPLSPCPNVFMYEPPKAEPGQWYGVVNLSTDIVLHSLWLDIVLDSKADVLGNWVGDVTTTDNIDFKVENTTMKILPGPATEVRFFVKYNQLSGTVPRLKSIRLNGREICNANHPLSGVDRSDTDTNRRDDITERPFRVSNTTIVTSITRTQHTLSSRPNTDTSPQDRPVTRDEDRPITRQVQETQPSDSGTVYMPQTNANPYSIDSQSPSQIVETPTATRPRPDSTYRVTTQRPWTTSTSWYIQEEFPVDKDSQSQSQIMGTQTVTRPRPDSTYQVTTQRARTTSTRRYIEYDFPEDKQPGEDEYFSGGLVAIITGNGTNRPNGGNKYFDTQSINNNIQDVCGKVVRNYNPNPLVVNGRPTLEGQWPWQIALYQTQTVDNKYICGGTLVSHKHIITAGHCVTKKGSERVVNKNTLTVNLGKHNLRTSVEGVQIRLVAQISVHPMYNASSFAGDLSMLMLREEVQFSDWVRPACLWPENEIDLSYVIGKKGAVVGWGFDDKGLATEELMLAEMPVVDQETCIRSYSEFFARFTSEYTFCAGYRNGTSVCNGDSGGGMVFNLQGTWYLRGLVSLSVARQNEYRCDPTHYVVFTDLAKFLPWIKRNIEDFSSRK